MPVLAERLQAALGGGYRVERELGGGGMSRVFVAEEVELGRKVVVKVLPPEMALGVNADRFRREIQLAASLQHPHIVPLLSAGHSDDLVWYTMPLIEGESLRAKVAREGELPVPEAVRVLRDVADALAYAHQHGVVHRDIKPDNVLIAGKHAVVTDFGVAKAISAATGEASLTSVGVALGTPAYMSPEQAAGGAHVDHRADIYSLGTVAYEVLTGRPPFVGLSPEGMLAAHVTQAPEPVTSHRAAVPGALAAVVMRCIEKKPADRWQSAVELHAQLEALATPSGGMTPTGAQPVAATQAPGWSRRRVQAVGAVAVGVLAIAVVAFVLLRRGSGPVVASASSIAVMPPGPAAPDSELQQLGRNLAVTLGANLDGVGEIRVIDPITILANTGDRIVTVDQGRRLARRFGAHSFLHGSLVREGSGVRLDAVLYGTARGEPLGRVSVSGRADDIAVLTDSATWALLREVWRTGEAPRPSFSAVTTHSLPALRAYLEGEHAMAQGRWRDAWQAFARATEADSTFWLAYWWFRYARWWMLHPVGPEDSVAVARVRAHEDDLPARERQLVQGFFEGSFGWRWEQYRDLASRYPDYLPAQMGYADRLFHSGGFLGHSPADAKVALQRVVDLDSGYTAALEHLAWIAGSWSRDSVEFNRILATLLRTPGYDLSSFGISSLGAAERFWSIWQGFSAGRAGAPQLDSFVVEMPRMAVGQYGAMLGIDFPAVLLEVNERLVRRGLSRSAAPGLPFANACAWAARGQWDSALAVGGRWARSQRLADAEVLAYQLAAVGAWQGLVRDSVAAGLRPPGPAALREAVADDSAGLYWADGLRAFARRDAAGLLSAARLISGVSGQRSRWLERSLGGMRLVLAGSPAARDSLERLVAVVTDSGPSVPRQPFFHGVVRLIAADLLLAAGDTVRADALLLWHWPVVNNSRWYAANAPLRPLALIREARIAVAQRRPDDARRYYGALVLMYDRPPAAHRAWIEEARAALARVGN